MIIKKNINNKLINYLIPTLFFIISFYFLPIIQLDNFKYNPGSKVDNFLNNYFLENIYLFIFKNLPSLWHLEFFYPFPYVLGFSDNLFGSAPIYIIARLFFDDPQTAFQFWFLAAYPINFFATYFALKKLGFETISATIGALVFTFGLPTSAHLTHLQLHYKFGLVLAIFYLLEFLFKTKLKFLILSLFWLTWQFYCGIYMGFFAACILFIIFITFIFIKIFAKEKYFSSIFNLIKNTDPRIKKIVILKTASFLLILFILMFFLLYPYLRVNKLYHFNREWLEISMMLPSLQSYLISDGSYLWGNFSKQIGTDLSMRHEHNMFIGLSTFILFLHGVYIGFRSGIKKEISILLLSSIVIIFIATLHTPNFSFWFYLFQLPLFSAIRAVTRFDQALLFPISYFIAISINSIQFKKYSKTITLFIISIVIFEFSYINIGKYLKSDWHHAVEQTVKTIKPEFKKNGIVFFAQSEKEFVYQDLAAMWASRKLGLSTLNGYSGSTPPGYYYYYDTDCTEIPRRIFAFLNFNGKSYSESDFLTLMNRVIPIGFDNCDPNWLIKAPSNTRSDRIYTAEEISNLKYEFLNKFKVADHWVVNIKISNFGHTTIKARSATGNPLRFSWRFIDHHQNIEHPWYLRKELPFDIAANESLILQIPIHQGMVVKEGSLQISFVQELVFWAHDIGIEPITIHWTE